ncbi:MAG: hypothetical protein ACXWWD_05610 [Chitinophagaceae bacterium]
MTKESTWTRRDKIIQILIFILTIVVGIEVGGSTFDDIVNNPIWTASPQAARAWAIQTGYFFRIFSPLMALLAIVTLIIGWKAKLKLKNPLIIATSIIILCFSVTMAYFVPELTTLRGNSNLSISEQEHIDRLRRWDLLDTIRYFFIFCAFIILLHCVGLTYKIREVLKQK